MIVKFENNFLRDSLKENHYKWNIMITSKVIGSNGQELKTDVLLHPGEVLEMASETKIQPKL